MNWLVLRIKAAKKRQIILLSYLSTLTCQIWHITSITLTEAAKELNVPKFILYKEKYKLINWLTYFYIPMKHLILF